MTNHSPYAPIEKSPLYAADQMQSKGYSVRLQDEESETGWKEVGLVSEDYLLVPNKEVRDMALEIAHQSPFEWTNEKTHFDGKRFSYALVANTGYGREVAQGDVVTIGMLFQNSYDGSLKLSASMFAYRLVCSNGMLQPETFRRMKFKHELRSSGWEEETRRALSMIEGAEENLERFCSAANRLAEMPVGSSELAHLRQDGLGDLPVTLWGRVLDRYLSEEEHTAWGLLNAGSNVVWHRDRSFSDYTHNETITQSLTEFAMEEAA
jgi:hypothetical protein